jgi:hypothetical protein
LPLTKKDLGRVSRQREQEIDRPQTDLDDTCKDSGVKEIIIGLFRQLQISSSKEVRENSLAS